MEVFAVFGRVALDGADVVAAGMGRIGRQAESMGQRISNIGGSVAAVGSRITTGLTIPILGAFTVAATSAMGFESSLARIEGLVGVAADEVENMGEQILKLAPKVGQGPAELADALFFITSAGLRGTEAMDVLELSAIGAASGLGDVKTIADLTTSAMNAYGSENLSAAQATDILANAVRQGKAEPEELAGAMGQVLPIAAELGVRYDEVAAALAGMTRTGTGAAQAGTQVRQVLATLLKPSNQANEQLEAMGLSAEGLRRQIREEGLIETLQTLKQTTEEYGEEALATVFPNIRALVGVLDLMGENADDNIAIFDALADSTGVLDESFAAVEETARFKLSQAMTTVRTLLTSIGLSVLEFVVPAMDRLVSLLVRVTDWWLELDDGVKRSIITWGLVVAAIGPVIWVIGRLIMLFGSLLSPIGLVRAAIGLLIVAFTTNFLGIRDIVLGVVRSVEDNIGSITDAIQTFREALSGEWVDDSAIMPLHRIVGLIGSLARTIFALVTGDFNEFYRMTLKAPEFLQPLLLGLDSLLAIFERIFNAVKKDGFAAGFHQLIEELPNIGELIGGVFSGAVGIIADFIGGIDWSAVGNAAWEAIQGAFELAVSAGSWVVDLGGSIVTRIWNAIPSADEWKEVGETIWERVQTAAELAVAGGEVALEFGKSAVEWFADQFNSVDWDSVSDTVADKLNDAYQFALDVVEEAIDLAQRFTDWLIEQIENVSWDSAATEMESGFERLFGFLGEFFDKLDIVHDINEKIVEPLSDHMMSLRETLGPLVPILVGVAAGFLAFKAISGVVAIIAGIAAGAGTLLAVLNPLSLIIIGVAVAIGLLVAAFVGNWGGFRDAVMGALEPMIENFKIIVDVIREELGPTLVELAALWDALKPVLKVIGVILGITIITAIGLVMGVLGGLIGMLAGALPGAFQVARGIIQLFTGTLNGITAIVRGVIDVVSALFRGDWKEAFYAARDTVLEVTDAVVTILTGFKDIALGIADAFVKGFAGFIEGLVDSVVGFFTGLWNSLTGNSIIPDMVDDILEVISGLVDDFKEFISGLVDDVVGFFVNMASDAWDTVSGFASDVVDTVSEMVDDVLGFVGELPDKIKGIFSGAGEWLVESGKDILKGLISGLTDPILNNRVVNTVGGLASSGVERFNSVIGRDSPAKEFIAAALDMLEGLLVGIDAKEPEVIERIASMADKIIGTLQSAFDLAERLPTIELEWFDLWTDELDERMYGLLRTVVGFMDAFAAEIDEEVLEAVNNAASKLTGIFRPFIEAIGFLEAIQDVTIDQFDAWSTSLDEQLWMLTRDVFGAIDAFAGAWDLDVMQATQTAAESMLGIFGPFQEAIGFINTLNEDLEDNLAFWTKDLEDGLRYITIDVLEVMWAFAATWSEEVMEAAGEAGTVLQTIFNPFNAALDFVERAKDFVFEDFGFWSKDFENALRYMTRDVLEVMWAFAATWDMEVMEAAGEAGAALSGIFGPFNEALEFIERASSVTREDVEHWIDNLEDLVIDMALLIAQRMIEASEKIEQASLDAAAEMAESLQPIFGLVRPFVEAIEALGKQGVLTEKMIDRWLDNMLLIVRGLEQMPDFALVEIKDSVLEIFEGAGEWLFDAGVDIMDGLIQGIESKVRDLEQLLTDISEQIPEWKGPASVDDKLLRPAASRIMGGFIAELASHEDNLKRTMMGITTSMSDALNNSLSGVSGSGVGKLSGAGFNPEIRVYVGREEVEDIVVEAVDRRFRRSR